MAESDGKRPERPITLTVTAELQEAESAEKRPEAFAYAFSAGGRLLARERLDDKGTARLQLPEAREARAVRVVVGPDAGEEGGIAELLRRGAVEQRLRIDPGDTAPTARLVVAPSIWPCWLLSLCFVRGTLLKRVQSGGIWIDMPVCNATVEIYEVDPIPIIIPRLPDLVIERIRDVIINPPPPPPPPVETGPFPGPFPAPFPPGPAPFMQAAMPQAGPMPEAAQAETAQRMLSGATELQFLARSLGTAQFRQALIANAAIVRHILCLVHLFPVTKVKVATATTDDCGHFQTFFFRGCHNPDTPDLYFKATQSLFGFFDVTIYAPTPVACYTHWNYVCGTEVTLYTSHPFAMTCPPCPPVVAPDNWVLVMAIGNHPLSLIRGTGEALQVSTDPTNIGLTDGDAPFGGLLRPRVEFDNSLRDDLGVRYYQMSYRKGTSGSFIPLTGEVHRHYTHEVGGSLVLEVVSLGPKVVNGVPNLFEIPPGLPPVGQYSFPDLVEDLASAKFPTNDLAPLAAPGAAWPEHGTYQLKLDLFDNNAAPVDIGAKGIVYRVPTSTDLSGTIETTDAAALGLVSGNSFIMTLHIDNSRCLATIDPPTLNGVPASPNCGVLDYDPDAPGSVEMDYSAVHANGFATYSFAVYRGVNLVASASGAVGSGSFSLTSATTDLLGGCSVAGFSENLYVAAKATDGWRRLHEYDHSAVGAFVLAPTPPD